MFVIILPLYWGIQHLAVPAFCKYICPAGTLEGAIGLLSHPANNDALAMLGPLFTSKFVILVLITAACVFCFRAFCRFLCPLGALYGLFSRYALLGVTLDESACTHCGHCMAQCPMDVRSIGDRECIHCGRCAKACPTQAIRWRSIRPSAKGSRPVRRLAAWALALLFLAGWLWFVNRPDGSPTAVAPQTAAAPVADERPVGHEPGCLAPDFTVPLYGPQGGEFRLADTRGKVTVINFWATWCGPCVKELPLFEQIRRTWPEDTAVVAIHANLVTEDVQAWLSTSGRDLPYALDPDGAVLSAYGGSTMLPMTVVLDRTGGVVYNRIGSVTWEQLEALITPLL